MERIARLLFEARSLKALPRSGYQFLGAGRESVAEHTFTTTFIAYVIGHLLPDVDRGKLITMCLLHDLPEARIGDLNYVQKFYVEANETAALDDLTEALPFGDDLQALIEEFNDGESLEARLAQDADQLALLVELADLARLGYAPPHAWVPNVRARLQTDLGRKMADAIMAAPADAWWRKKFIDRTGETK